jgi:hypothetical protein
MKEFKKKNLLDLSVKPTVLLQLKLFPIMAKLQNWRAQTRFCGLQRAPMIGE